MAFSRRTLMVSLIAGLAFLTTPPRGGAADPVADGSKAFIEAMIADAMDLLADENLSTRERVERFRDIFNQYFAVETIGKWVLGRYWRSATPEQRAEYLRQFEDLIVYGYVKRFQNYRNENVRVIRSVASGDGLAIVFCELDREKGGEPIRLDWRVGYKSGAYKVLDVIVQGTSLSQTLRSDFGATAQQSGGTIDGLNKSLSQKVANLKTEMGV